MAKKVDYLLIGGGLASAFNAETLRKEGATGSITLITEENFLPYYRPQLARAFLLGKRKIEQLHIFSQDYYKKLDVDVLLNTKVLTVDPGKKTVSTNEAGNFNFKKLLIATGCSPQKIDFPGSHLAGIYYLKTIQDAQPIIQEMEHARNVVIVGGSFIGIEIASLLMDKNIKLTLIVNEFTLFHISPSEEIALFIRSHGVEVLLHEQVTQFTGKERVRAVKTSSGKKINCDFVLIADQYVPETNFLQGSGIELDDGIVVDQYLQSNQADIYAAGDVARFCDPLFKNMHRNGGVDNAIKQGRISALNMLGMRKSYYNASYFYFYAFDTPIVIIGDTIDTEERIVRGSFKEKNFAFLYLKDNLLQGAFFSGRPVEEIKAAESLILNRVNLKPYKKHLHHLDFSLEPIATQTVLALQGGGALGAFECGVIKAMEEQGVYPNIVSGISIGAFNSAIIAANPYHATEALEGFWNDLAVDLLSIGNESVRRFLSSWHSIVWGSPNFFYPRWAMPIMSSNDLPIHWTSFYDTSNIKNLLHKYVDFSQLKNSPIRLLVMAVNVETSEFEAFDSFTDEITADHILASGSIPPGFPWTTIDQKHYWDGAIVTNTPIDVTLDICGSSNKKIYIVELYSRNHALPKNMIEVLARKDEILFSEKIRKNVRSQEQITSYKKLIERILNYCDPAAVEEIKQLPAYIQNMGDPGIQSITRIIRETAQDEPYAWDSDFSRETIEQHKQKGYETTKKILKKEERKKMPGI